MTWTFLTVSNVVALQKEQIVTFGGSHGLRDAGLLESAVNRARNKVEYEEGATVPQVAASLSYGLIKNHAFIDGNKRIGLVVLNAFLRANGFRLTKNNGEAAPIVQEVAASGLSEQEWSDWVEQHSTPLRN